MLRSIRRNAMKKQVKSNKIRNRWRLEQIGKYGFDNWMYNYFIPCNGKTSSLNDSFKDAVMKMLKDVSQK